MGVRGTTGRGGRLPGRRPRAGATPPHVRARTGHQACDSTDQPSSHSQLFLNRFGICSKTPHGDTRGATCLRPGQLGTSFSSTSRTFYKPKPGFSPLTSFFFFFFGQISWCFAEIQKTSNAVEYSFLNADFQNLFFFSGGPFLCLALLSVKLLPGRVCPSAPGSSLGAKLYISPCSVLLLLVRFPLRFSFRK